MVPRPKLSRTVERCNDVFYDFTGLHIVGSGVLSRVRESNPILLDYQTGDRSPRDMGCVPLKESREECFAQHFFHWLKLRPYAGGEALHETPLLLEELLQACVGGMQVLDHHPGQYGH